MSAQKALILAELAQFHRDVFLPDVQRVVQEVVGASERRLTSRLDGIAHELTAMRIESAALRHAHLKKP